MTWLEHLMANGATAEEAKLLDTAAARKSYDALQASITEADRIKAAAKQEREDLNKWFNDEATPYVTKVQREATEAKAEAARVKAILESAQNQGLIDLAKGAGVDPKNLDPARVAATGVFDEDKFLREKILPIAEREGDAIAMAQDIAAEHAKLFPDRPLNFRELRREAVSRRVSVEQMWEEKFGVPAARTAAEAARTKAREDAIRKEERDAVLADVASRYANPNTSPLGPSRNPFAQRTETGRTKQPWELGGGEDGSALQSDRVRRATEKLMKNAVTN